jgi:alpha-glucosidase
VSDHRLLLIITILLGLCPSALATTLISHTIDGHVVRLHTDEDLQYSISFLADNIVRIEATTGNEFTNEGSGAAPIIVATDLAVVAPTVTERNNQLAFTTAALELIIHHSPVTMELRRLSDGRTLWRERKPLTLTENSCTQTLDSDPHEHFHGGGQQNGYFEFKGRLMEISYSGWEEGDRPSPAPFYMSDRGYGVLRNTWADGTYDFRSDTYLTATHSENRFDAYFMVGQSIHEVLGSYTRLTGRARLLPRWAFGYGDADCYNDGDNSEKPNTFPEGWSDGPTGTTPDVVESVAAKYREHDMPGGWILPNDGYGCGYVDLPETVARLRKLGFRTGLWTENGVEKIAWEIGTAGTRVQKLDVAWTGKGYQWAMDANHDAAWGFIENANARPFIWTVMGWAGIQRYAVTWTGDQSGSWDFIRWHIPTLIGSGLSGMNYSTGDVDGIFGGSPETFTRDLQWKCFTPVLMGMSGWSKNARKHPWAFDEPYLSINRRYLKLRQRLMPYLYTLARETELTGAPMVRGVCWDHPDDSRAHDFPYQFFLGRELLVAPVYRSQAASNGWRDNVYLPEGRWIDYWTGLILDASADGRAIDVPVDLATLPVFVRAGAIIPMYPESLYDNQLPADPLTLDLYPAGVSKFTLYEDDGDTRAYRDGAFSEQCFTSTAANNQIELVIGAVEGDFEGRLENRNYLVQLHTGAGAISVALDGKSLSPVKQNGKPGWRYDASDRGGVIHIETGSLPTSASYQLTIKLDTNTQPILADAYPERIAGDGTIDADAITVLGRPAEEPGYPLENAFDGDPDTWFRTVRDQSFAFGPHEFVVSLGGRSVIEGLRIAPRNDKWWEYGQVREYEVYLADVNGEWGQPIASGSLIQSDQPLEIRFTPRAGRLLRFRVPSVFYGATNDSIAQAEAKANDKKPYNAMAPVQVNPLTISEFEIFERPAPLQPVSAVSLAEVAGFGDLVVPMNGLDFSGALSARGDSRFNFALTGDWHSFRAEVGFDNSAPISASARFQIWGDEQLLWDSGHVASPATTKMRLDLRGVNILSLRTTETDPTCDIHWTELVLDGYISDSIKYLGTSLETPSQQETNE